MVAPAPATEGALVTAVREALAARRAVTIEGSGTKRDHGPAVTADVVLSTRALDQVSSYEPGDMVVTVQPGVRLAALQELLAERGQWLPIDPPFADATIGGILASASNGPRRLGYGLAKDMLLGARVLSPQGTVTRSGGRVVKNVTGYDLHKLHVGAFGTLGVILEAHLKVAPRPELSGVAVFACADFAAAHRLLLDVWGSTLQPVALEALDLGAGSVVRALAPALPDAEALALVGIEGSEPVFARHLRELESLRPRARSLTVVRGPAATAVWAALRDMPERRREQITVRLAARPRDLPTLVEGAAVEARALGTVAVGAQVGTGLARLQIGGAQAELVGAAVTTWNQRAGVGGGYAVVESAPSNLPGREDLPWGTAATALGRALRRQWDPGALMNPGRMAP